jgi:hypothetical protein
VSFRDEDLRENTTLTSVVIPDSVTYIGHTAFSRFSALTSVTLGSGLTHIEFQAFAVAEQLTNIVIPNSVTHIGGGAFFYCTSLTHIDIPDSVVHIGNQAFVGITNLTVTHRGVSYRSVRDNRGSWDIPQAFYDAVNSSNQSNAPASSNPPADSVEDPGRAFTFARRGDGIEITGYTGTSGIVQIPRVINGMPVTHIGEMAFYGNTTMTEVVIPDSVAHISAGAFAMCTGLTSVTIGDGVTYIGELAFGGLTGLTSIMIPDSVTRVIPDAFSGSTGLTATFRGVAYSYDSRAEDLPRAFYDAVRNNDPSRAPVPAASPGERVGTSAGDYTYIDVAGGVEITKYIGAAVNIIVPERINGRPVLRIGDSAFTEREDLISITIPGSVTAIGERAFSGCTNLMEVIIEYAAPRIDPSAFAGCGSLERMTIGNGEARLGGHIWFGGMLWRVLDIQDGKALILSEYSVRGVSHNVRVPNATWESSQVRRQLNNDFIEQNFTDEEKGRIAETIVVTSDNMHYGTSGGGDTTDRVFLLSIEEVIQYLSDPHDRMLHFARRREGNMEHRASQWWLRSTGAYTVHGAFVGTRGEVNTAGLGVNSSTISIRPALWLILQ